MKKINSLVIRSFIGPFVMTFFIALFILLMQFLWKYIDDLAGKGLEWTVIFKLMVFVAITLVPLALPLAILLSSIMTFGNLAEHYEIVACKSAGWSLQKVMRPLMVLTLLISGMAFYFSNNILPIANLKMNALLYDVTNQKPALYVREGVFYNGIDGYVLRVAKKDADNKTIHKIMIYDHTANRGNSKLILAEKGTMVMSEDERYLILTLFNGKSYEERVKEKGADTHPLMRTEFEKEVIRFDLSTFKLARTDEQLFKNNYQMLNLKQLSYAADSLERKVAESVDNYHQYNKTFYSTSSGDKLKPLPFTNKDFIQNFEKSKEPVLVSSALNAARNSKDAASSAAFDLDLRKRSLAKHVIEWHRKFTLPFACLILFFIGAPLGAIIRKGGLGMPVVVSVILFIIYHVISISGEKFAKEAVIPPYKGMWMSSIILLPVGIFLTYKATTDSSLFERDAYLSFFRKLFGKRGSASE